MWGQVMMPGHPQLTEAQAGAMVSYILGIGQARAPGLPVRGVYTPRARVDSAGQGIVVLRASYADRGANGVRGASADTTVVLRAPLMVVAEGDTADGVQKYKGPEVPVEVTIGTRSGGFVGLRRIDLTGIAAITLTALAPVPNVNAVGGSVEVRLDSATGVVVGRTRAVEPQTVLGAPLQLRAAIRPTTGMRDVYFVFRNDSAPAGRNLLVLFTAQFERARVR